MRALGLLCSLTLVQAVVVITPLGQRWDPLGLTDDGIFGPVYWLWESHCVLCDEKFYALAPTSFSHEEEASIFPFRHCHRCRGKNIVDLRRA